ncbi:Ras-related GTP-binding protein D [Acipenser ruthenus]|uniref:Ras-related GTP-binding protein D n=1 Tax=Acipenser ruthenus TaxID=7906 RepID=A0A444U3I1_ACIRT|nr:Ras-related GTP-binding protein D [Acipenser ruthenus]
MPGIQKASCSTMNRGAGKVKQDYLQCFPVLRESVLYGFACTLQNTGCRDPFSSEVKPRILLMGLRRSGKSSIQKVVFHKMSPNETLFLESTNKICREDVSNSSFVHFQIWDFPGQIDFFDPTFDYEMIFRGTGGLIFVIDSQDDYVEALSRLHLTVTRAYKVNPDINFEVFIHKVDGLSDDHKIEKQRDIHKRANDDLVDAALERIHLSFYLTSIYDHSIFEAFSKVVQKLIPQLPTLENLLNIFISNSGIEKAFLFDVVSKIYIATDSSPVDMQTYELCCDMIDVVIDISCIYGTALIAIIGFMPTKGEGAIGSLDYTPEERKALAKKSQDFCCAACGGSMKSALLPVTSNSNPTNNDREAKELARQISFKAESSSSSTAARKQVLVSPVSSEPSGEQASESATQTETPESPEAADSQTSLQSTPREEAPQPGPLNRPLSPRQRRAQQPRRPASPTYPQLQLQPEGSSHVGLAVLIVVLTLALAALIFRRIYLASEYKFDYEL